MVSRSLLAALCLALPTSAAAQDWSGACDVAGETRAGERVTATVTFAPQPDGTVAIERAGRWTSEPAAEARWRATAYAHGARLVAIFRVGAPAGSATEAATSAPENTFLAYYRWEGGRLHETLINIQQAGRHAAWKVSHAETAPARSRRSCPGACRSPVQR
jgi:hypothetical protein